jgi:hypothetical protein
VLAFFDDEQWAQVPGLLRRSVAGQTFRRILEGAARAAEAGAFDAPTATSIVGHARQRRTRASQAFSAAALGTSWGE